MDILFSGPIDLTQRLITTHNKGHSTYYYRLSYQSKYSWHIVDHNPLNGTFLKIYTMTLHMKNRNVKQNIKYKEWYFWN